MVSRPSGMRHSICKMSLRTANQNRQPAQLLVLLVLASQTREERLQTSLNPPRFIRIICFEALSNYLMVSISSIEAQSHLKLIAL